MASTHHLGLLRDAVNADLHATAESIATAFGIENPIADLDLLGVRINGSPTETAAYLLRQMEYNSAVLHLLRDCLLSLKTSPPAD